MFLFQHLLSNSSDLQTDYSGGWGLPLLGAGFLYHILSPTRLIPDSSVLQLQLLNRGPEGPLCWMLAFSTASCHHLVWSPNWLIGGLMAPSADCRLSLPHLVSNWSGLQNNWLPVFTELDNSSTPTFFLWASQIALIQPIHGQGYTLLFLDRMHLLFTLVHFILWQPGRVVGQYTTHWNINEPTNPDLETRPTPCEQKEKNLSSSEFCRFSWTLKENKKMIWKYLDFAWGLKKLWNMKVMVIPTVFGAF